MRYSIAILFLWACMPEPTCGEIRYSCRFEKDRRAVNECFADVVDCVAREEPDPCRRAALEEAAACVRAEAESITAQACADEPLTAALEACEAAGTGF